MVMNDPAATSAGQTTDPSQSAGEKVKDRLRETSQEVAQRTRQIATDARARLGDEVRTAARSGAACISSGCRDAGDALAEASGKLRQREDTRAATYVEQAADGLHRASRYFEERTPEQIADDAGDVVRRHPGLVLGGVFAVGLLTGRFLRASSAARSERDWKRERRSSEGAAAYSPEHTGNAPYDPSRSGLDEL